MHPQKIAKKEIEDVDDEPLKSRQIKVLKISLPEKCAKMKKI